MKLTLTAKLKLNHTPEQKAALDAITLSFRDALNFTSQRAFELDKSSNAAKIQKEVYTTLRERFGLGAQMACSVPRQVGATYKTLWTKVKQSVAKRAVNPKARRYKGLDSAPKFVSRTLSYQYQRDYSFKKGQQVSVSTLAGRLVLPYEGYARHLESIAAGAEIGAGKLWYDRQKKQYFLLVPLEIELPDPDPMTHKQVVGVDVGMRYFAVANSTSNQTLFKSGKKTLRKAERFQKASTSLQQKGTRSATRRLVSLSGRERRFIADTNSSLASEILRTYPHAFIGIEDLTGIRDRTERRSRPDSSEKQRTANRRRARWSYAELLGFLAYKAPLHGSFVVKVDAHYTSQTCARCGHCSKGNRPDKGLMFVCESCGYRLHADLMGARNVGLRALVVRQDWATTGRLSCAPDGGRAVPHRGTPSPDDVSDAETKAERLKRYSELRWSPDASPRL